MSYLKFISVFQKYLGMYAVTDVSYRSGLV